MTMHVPFRFPGLVPVLAAVVLAALGGSAGVCHAQDAATQRMRAEGAVKDALKEARQLLEQEKELERCDPQRWAATVSLAEAAVKRAEIVITLVEVPANLQKRVRALRAEVDGMKRDTDLRLQLDRIRQEQTSIKEGRFDFTATAASYRAALGSYGIDPAAPEEAGAVARSSRCRRELLAALEDWARATDKAEERKRVLAVLEAMEPGPGGFRARWRAAVQKKDGAALVALAGSVSELPAADVVNLARDLVRLHEVKAAAALLREGRARFPEDFWLNHDLGMVLQQQSPPQPAEAIRFLTIAVALRPQSPAALNNLGVALEEQGRLAEAIGCFHKAIELEPRFPQAHNNLGNALAARGETDEAIRCFRRVIALEPTNAQAHASLGVVLSAMGQLEEAIQCFRKAIALDPANPQAYNSLGMACYSQRKLDEAVAALHKALALDPKLVTAHYNLGQALNAKGQLEEAIRCFRKAIELDPKEAHLHATLGQALLARKDFEGARQAFRRCLELLEKTKADP